MNTLLSSWDTSRLDGPSVGIGVNEVEVCTLFGPISFFFSFCCPHPGLISLHFIYMTLLQLLYSFFILVFSICFIDDFIFGPELARAYIWDLIKNCNLEGWE